jgi:CHAT domain-containing protein
LLDVRKRLATLTLAVPRAGAEARRSAELERLAKEEQQLAKELGQKSGQHLTDDPWVGLDAVRAALPADAVLIDVARFRVLDFQARDRKKLWQPAHYAAWVIPPAGKGEVRLLDLGAAEKIDATVAKIRRKLQAAPAAIRADGEPDAEAALRQELEALSQQVLAPLLPHVEKSRQWVISPDGPLWLVPWAALPVDEKGTYAVEKHTLRYVVSGRDLVGRPSVGKAEAAWVLADPDFDLAPQQAKETLSGLVPQPVSDLGLRGLVSADKLPRFGRLPGTAAEARAITPKLKTYTGQEPALRTGKEALEGVFKALAQPRLVVLSTHGYFLPDQQAALSDPLGTVGTRPALTREGKPLENPLLRCGLALAGANRREDLPEGADDGILTGLEIVGTDLRGCELVVLSACETGLGEVNVGEGVAGLRQAFQLAGAHAVLATLWQIPDKETAQLMTQFFDGLAHKQDRAEALRQAQLAIIKQRREQLDGAAHPFYWAAFTLTGQGR